MPKRSCEHGKRIGTCNKCPNFGSQYCVHRKRKQHCTLCTSMSRRLASKQFCLVCTERRIRRPRTICKKCMHPDFIKIEDVVLDTIQMYLPKLCEKNVYLSTSKRDRERLNIDYRRISDAVWYFTDRIVTLEIDEMWHRDRDIECELSKLTETRVSVEDGSYTKPLITVRFGVSRKNIDIFLLQQLILVLRNYIQIDASDMCLFRNNVLYVNYHIQSKHVCATKQHPMSLNFLGCV